MSGRKTIITIEHFKGGQQRPYGDMEYQARISARSVDETAPADAQWRDRPVSISRAEAEALTRAHVSGWEEAGQGNWASARLKHLRPQGVDRAEVWDVLVTSPYTD